MTTACPNAHDMSAGDSRAPLAAASSPSGGTEFPMRVIVDATDGLDGLMRVAMMLRARRYRVRNLNFHEGVVAGEVRATVLVTASEVELLLSRLRRITVVTSARWDEPAT
jgi:hypothetical protein